MVYGCLYGLVQGIRKLFLVYIMLILAYANGFGIYFYQLCQRILHPAGNGNSSPNGNIVFGQFFLGQSGGGVNGSSCFVGNDIVDIQLVVLDKLGGKFLGFQGGCAVANGDKAHLITADYFQHGAGGLGGPVFSVG